MYVCVCVGVWVYAFKLGTYSWAQCSGIASGIAIGTVLHWGSNSGEPLIRKATFVLFCFRAAPVYVQFLLLALTLRASLVEWFRGPYVVPEIKPGSADRKVSIFLIYCLSA